jgi:hypothetical protein
MLLTEMYMLFEGGNVFKTPEGLPVTGRINQQDVGPTVKWLESITGISLADNMLGSTGKKASSGDIDLAVSSFEITKDELVNKLSTFVSSIHSNPSEWVKKSGVSVHFKTPVNGNVKNGFVQTDFMFGDDTQFMRFGLHASKQSRFSGADRNLLMSSLAKADPALDLKYSWQKGLIKRSTNTLITKDPEKIAVILLGPGHIADDLDSVETIMHAIKTDTGKISQLTSLINTLRNTEGKNPGAIRVDSEEVVRLIAALRLA